MTSQFKAYHVIAQLSIEHLQARHKEEEGRWKMDSSYRHAPLKRLQPIWPCKKKKLQKMTSDLIVLKLT